MSDLTVWPYLKSKDDESRKGRALLDCYDEEELADKTVVAFETYDRGRKYTVFDDVRSLNQHIKFTPFNDLCMHEVIMAWLPQKPRFDIDIELEDLKEGEDLESTGQKVFEMTLESVIKVLKFDGIDLDIEKSVILCSSHGPKKRSFHLIIHGWIHPNHLEAAAFYEKILENSEDPEYLKRFLDHSIYSANHLLRLLHCHKLSDSRVKKLDVFFEFRGQKWEHKSTMKPRNDDHKNFIFFFESLISFRSNCEMMPVYQTKKIERDFDAQLPDGAALTALEAIAQNMNMDMEDIPFEIREIKGTLIDLRRIRSSYCKLCKKVHDNLDPFIVFIGDDIYFHCRSAPKGLKYCQKIGALQNSEKRLMERISVLEIECEDEIFPEECFENYRKDEPNTPCDFDVKVKPVYVPSVFTPPSQTYIQSSLNQPPPIQIVDLNLPSQPQSIFHFVETSKPVSHQSFMKSMSALRKVNISKLKPIAPPKKEHKEIIAADRVAKAAARKRPARAANGSYVSRYGNDIMKAGRNISKTG